MLVGLTFGLNRFLLLADIYARQEPGKLLTLLEGASAAITVHQRTPSDRVISINGVNVAGTNPVLRATQKLQAHLPVCLHRNPRSVLQIGFGSGGTCYSVSLHPEIQSIEVVELNPDVLKIASAWFSDINHGVLNNPRVRARIVDAKSHVAATHEMYDLILSDSTHPRWFRGNAALYAADYFTNCLRRTQAGVSSTDTASALWHGWSRRRHGILKSFHSVFPHVQVWYANSEPHENTIVIASLDPIAIDPGLLAMRLAEATVAGDLAEVGITSIDQVLDFFIMGDRAVAEFSRTGRLNTDDHPRLEFLAPRRNGRKKSRSWSTSPQYSTAREPIDQVVGCNGQARHLEELLAGMGTTSWPVNPMSWKAAPPMAWREGEEGTTSSSVSIIG